MQYSPEQSIEYDRAVEGDDPLPPGVVKVVHLSDPVPQGVRDGERGGRPASPRNSIISASFDTLTESCTVITINLIFNYQHRQKRSIALH